MLPKIKAADIGIIRPIRADLIKYRSNGWLEKFFSMSTNRIHWAFRAYWFTHQCAIRYNQFQISPLGSQFENGKKMILVHYLLIIRAFEFLVLTYNKFS